MVDCVWVISIVHAKAKLHEKKWQVCIKLIFHGKPHYSKFFLTWFQFNHKHSIVSFCGFLHFFTIGNPSSRSTALTAEFHEVCWCLAKPTLLLNSANVQFVPQIAQRDSIRNLVYLMKKTEMRFSGLILLSVHFLLIEISGKKLELQLTVCLKPVWM